jgi:hypothetical protein
MKIKALPLFAIGGFFIYFGIKASKFTVSHSGTGTYWYYGVISGGYIAIVVGLLAILWALLLAVRYMIYQHLRYHGYESWRDLDRNTRSQSTVPRNRVGGGR